MVPKQDMSQFIVRMKSETDFQIYLRVFASDNPSVPLFDDMNVSITFKIVGFYEG